MILDSSYDLIILGGGIGGYVAAIRAAQLGLKTAVVEKDKVGGTCLHRGCIPTKAFLESAEVLSIIRRSEEFGLKAQEPSLDYQVVARRKDGIVSQLHKGVEFLLSKNGVTTIKGEGRLLSPKKLAVVSLPAHRMEGEKGQARELETKNIIIATGSRPKALPGLPFDGDKIINSDHALELKDVPHSVIIIGAGAVGVEFASLYRDFGAEVTIVELLPTLVPLEDKDIGTALARSFSRRGIKVLTGAKVLSDSAQRDGDGIALDVETAGKKEKLSADKVLVAVGREGCVQDIGLENTTAEIERGFIKVDQYMATKEEGIYAIGDVIGGMLLAHVAMAEGTLAVEKIAGKKVTPLDYHRVPRCTYCRPQVATLGLSEEEAIRLGGQVKVGRFPFAANSRALIMGETEGFVKMVADAATGELLGVHIIGPHATELLAESALARFLEATPLEIGLSIHPHPALSEAIGEAALELEGRPIHIWHG